MRRRRGRRHRREKQKKKEDIQSVADDLNSLFSAAATDIEKETEIISTETFKLSEEEKQEILNSPNPPLKTKKKPKTKFGKMLNFIKKHVRPDVGIGPFKEGEGPDFKNDNMYEIGEKLKQNLKIGLKLTIKF
jgi:hypothetical protein